MRGLTDRFRRPLTESELSRALRRSKVNDAGGRERMYRLELDTLERVTRTIGLRAGRVLDIGCGDGAFLALLQERGWEPFGVEVRDEVKAAAASRGVVFNGYDYDDEFFGLIVMRGVVHHIENIEEVLSTAYRLLAVDGLLAVLSTPDAESVCYRRFHEMPMLIESQQVTKVYRVWGKRELTKHLTGIGFHVASTRSPYLGTPYARPLTDLGSFLLRLLGRPAVFPFWGNMMEIYATKRRQEGRWTVSST